MASRPSGAYPIPQPVKLDLEKAKEYLKAAGMPDGFSTTFSFNVGQASTAEPMAALVKESLGQDRHQGRYPEAAGRADVDADQ